MPYKTIETTAAASETPTKSRGGAPKGNKNAAKHKHYVRKAALAQVGFNGIDRRTAAGRELAARRTAILNDLGGEESLSQIQLDLVEKYMRLAVLIDSLDAWLFSQKSLINRRNRCLYPIVRERASLEDSALRLAQAIGLDRAERKPLSLPEYIAQRNSESRQEKDE